MITECRVCSLWVSIQACDCTPEAQWICNAISFPSRKSEAYYSVWLWNNSISDMIECWHRQRWAVSIRWPVQFFQPIFLIGNCTFIIGFLVERKKDNNTIEFRFTRIEYFILEEYLFLWAQLTAPRDKVHPARHRKLSFHEAYKSWLLLM